MHRMTEYMELVVHYSFECRPLWWFNTNANPLSKLWQFKIFGSVFSENLRFCLRCTFCLERVQLQMRTFVVLCHLFWLVPGRPPSRYQPIIFLDVKFWVNMAVSIYYKMSACCNANYRHFSFDIRWFSADQLVWPLTRSAPTPTPSNYDDLRLSRKKHNVLA